MRDPYRSPAVRITALLRHNALTWALPRLTRVAPEQWRDALAVARATDFDAIERVGILAALALTSALLRSATGGGEIVQPTPLLIHLAAQFIAALPLLALFAGPFYLRCLRRGLDHFIAARQAGR